MGVSGDSSGVIGGGLMASLLSPVLSYRALKMLLSLFFHRSLWKLRLPPTFSGCGENAVI